MNQATSTPHPFSLLRADVPGVSITGERHAHGRLVYRDLLLPTVPANGPWSCLDIGSGNGYLLSLLARDANRVVALEPNRENEPSLRKNLSEFSQLAIEFETLENSVIDSYTYVLACHSLYNVKDYSSVCAKICDAIEDGGRAVVIHHTTEGTYDKICAAGLRGEGRAYSPLPYQTTALLNAMRARDDGHFSVYQAELAIWLGSVEQATEALMAQLHCKSPAARAAMATELKRYASYLPQDGDMFLTSVDAVLIFDRTSCPLT